MIFIEDKLHINPIKFPKNFTKSEQIYTISLISRGTNQTYQFEAADEGTFKDYYVFSIDFSGCKNGEFEYSIGENKGLIQIGEIKHTAEEYKKDEVFIEYRN